MTIFNSTNLSAHDYLLKHTLIYLGMRKISDEKLEKLRTNGDLKDVMTQLFDGSHWFLFAVPSGAESFTYVHETPSLKQITKKIILVMRAKAMPIKVGKSMQGDIGKIEADNIADELLFMEINRQILENLYLISNEVFMPIMGNPQNMMGWSDLVSKDLMDKMHVYLAHTFVTIGQIKGRTLLPLPPNDVTSSEKTSSKDKSLLLENAIIHWTK